MQYSIICIPSFLIHPKKERRCDFRYKDSNNISVWSQSQNQGKWFSHVSPCAHPCLKMSLGSCVFIRFKNHNLTRVCTMKITSLIPKPNTQQDARDSMNTDCKIGCLQTNRKHEIHHKFGEACEQIPLPLSFLINLFLGYGAWVLNKSLNQIIVV